MTEASLLHALETALPDVAWSADPLHLGDSRFVATGLAGDAALVCVDGRQPEAAVLGAVLDALAAGPALLSFEGQGPPQGSLSTETLRVIVLVEDSSASLRRRLGALAPRVQLLELTRLEGRGGVRFLSRAVPLGSLEQPNPWEGLGPEPSRLLQRLEQGLRRIHEEVEEHTTGQGARTWRLGGEVLAEVRVREGELHAVLPWAGCLRAEEDLALLLEACVASAFSVGTEPRSLQG